MIVTIGRSNRTIVTARLFNWKENQFFNVMMKNVWLTIILLPLFGQAQQLKEYNEERLQLDKRLMLTLTGWSTANALVGAYGWATTENEALYFHQMNVMWTGVNLALAIPGYFKAKNGDPSLTFAQTWHEQQKTEKVFLFNTALDLTYITGGFFLKQRALVDETNYFRYRGWGNSLILQGGFLFLFDLTATLLHSRHRKEKLSPFLERVELSDNGLGLRYSF